MTTLEKDEWIVNDRQSLFSTFTILQFLKYSLVGGVIGTILGTPLTFFFTQYAGIWYIWSGVIAGNITNVLGYLIRRYYVFGSKR